MAVLKEDEKRTIYRIRASMVLYYKSSEEARNNLKSVDVDNYNFVKCRRDKNKIRCKVESETVSSLLHTLDDFLACIILAEEVYRSI